MKSYVEIDGEKLYLPQEVDPHRFEVCVQRFDGEQPFYLLCPITKTRYRQATGALLERFGKELQLHTGSVITRTFPLIGLETYKLSIDWSVGAQPSFTAKESPEENTNDHA